MRNENEKSFAGEVKVDKESGQTLNNLYRPLVEGVECVSTLLYHDIAKIWYMSLLYGLERLIRASILLSVRPDKESVFVYHICVAALSFP